MYYAIWDYIQNMKYTNDKSLQAKHYIQPTDVQIHPWRDTVKRVIDITHALGGMVLCCPIVLVATIAIKIESEGPIIFKQERIGINGKMFTIYKLRTMYQNADDKIVQSAKDVRITKTGKILRKYSIDEIPQLYNILRGDMSLVGPRPLTIKSFEQRCTKYPNYGIRHTVKPGLCLGTSREYNTNLGRTEREYIHNRSLIGDLRIFVKIVQNVIHGRNF